MNKKAITISVIATVAILSVAALSRSFAAENNSIDNFNRGGWMVNSDAHQQMLDAINNNDYNKWKEVREKTGMGNRGMMSNINEQNFSKFAEAHRLVSEGKVEEARNIMQELGVGNGGCPMGGGGGRGRGMMNGGRMMNNI